MSKIKSITSSFTGLDCLKATIQRIQRVLLFTQCVIIIEPNVVPKTTKVEMKKSFPYSDGSY